LRAECSWGFLAGVFDCSVEESLSGTTLRQVAGICANVRRHGFGGGWVVFQHVAFWPKPRVQGISQERAEVPNEPWSARIAMRNGTAVIGCHRSGVGGPLRRSSTIAVGSVTLSVSHPPVTAGCKLTRRLLR